MKEWLTDFLVGLLVVLAWWALCTVSGCEGARPPGAAPAARDVTGLVCRIVSVPFLLLYVAAAACGVIRSIRRHRAEARADCST